MSAPILWIAVPFIAGVLILFFFREEYVAYLGGAAATALALIAFVIPIDAALLLGGISIKIAPSVEVFGRSFSLPAADAPLLTMIYGSAALWFFGAKVSRSAHRFVALGLIICALLTASIAVEPFLYAALLLEIAAMLTIPLLAPLYQKPSRGVIRFLVYQTLAMPFILFSGWLLAGAEASPADVNAAIQSGLLALMGFAFLFSVFPLYSWIPQIMEETAPYAAGFLLWALPTFTAIFALGFFERYIWLLNTPQIAAAILFSGVLMTASGGLFAAAQRHLGRIFGYAVVAEVGLILVALGLHSSESANLVFLIVLPRSLELSVYALALSVVKGAAYRLSFDDVKGLIRKYPIAVGALIVAHLSLAGFPLLAGFPSRLALWRELSAQSLTAAFWVFFGMAGLIVAAARALSALVAADDDAKWQINESWIQSLMLGLGVLGIFILGMFPQMLAPFLANLPQLFERLAQ
ncbi:MAG: hypothetical protein LC099_04675 [Anaerolineales bacterium]|nr:hypothetical protein [Anaerolineales bacterium]